MAIKSNCEDSEENNVQNGKSTLSNEIQIGKIKVKADLMPDKNSKQNLKRSLVRNKNKTVSNSRHTQDRQPRIFLKTKGKNTDDSLKVQRVLPHWLTNPTIIGNDLKLDGCDLTEFPYLKNAHSKLTEEKITTFFPVQKCLIPEIVSQMPRAFTHIRRNDICVSAATGSGKTLAYVLPILHCIATYDLLPKIQAVVILPTQQLALQVLRVFRSYAHCFNVNVGSAIGSRPTAEERQELVESYTEYEVTEAGLVKTTKHRSKVHVVVATPGKLEAHMELTSGFDLKHLLFLVFDEADILLSNDGGEWVRKIERKVRDVQGDSDFTASSTGNPPVYAQRILLSATLSCDPELLDAMDLYNPILFRSRAPLKRSNERGAKKNASKSTTEDAIDYKNYVRPAELTEELLYVEASVKPLALHHLLKTKQWTKVLVFVNSAEDGHDLAFLLQELSQQTYKVAEFSAKLGRNQMALSHKFRKGAIDVLVSTDIMDRGMDMDVEAVINYHVPMSKEMYVHRVGRTARAGRKGLALTLLNAGARVNEDFKKVVKNVKETHLDIKELHAYEEQYKGALEALKKSQEEMKRWKKINWKKHGVGIKRKQDGDGKMNQAKKPRRKNSI